MPVLYQLFLKTSIKNICKEESCMKITVTKEALAEIKSVAEREKIKNPAVYLDIEKSCCSSVPKVEVGEQTLGDSEMLENVNGIPVFACDLIKNLFTEDKERNDLELQVDFLLPYGLLFQFLKTSDARSE
ncbi:MAG: hypothetical protein ACUVTM_02725 [Candidatus Bathyarchaeia archaeon]